MLKSIKKISDKYDQNYTAGSAEDFQVCQQGIEEFGSAILDNCLEGAKKGRGGWHRPDECSVIHLTELFHKAVEDGNVVKIGTYAMMLHGRGVANLKADVIKARLSELSEEIVKLTSAQDEVQLLKAMCNQPESGSDWNALSATARMFNEKIDRLNTERLALLKTLG